MDRRCQLWQQPRTFTRWLEMLSRQECDSYQPRIERTERGSQSLCDECQFLLPDGRCQKFLAGCDGHRRRLAVLASGRCRHRQPVERPHVHYQGRQLAADCFVTMDDLLRETRHLAAYLADYRWGGLIAVARSGVFPATVMALLLHLPVWVVSPVRQELRPLGCGHRLGGQLEIPPQAPLLVVDDSASFGGTMEQVLRVLRRVCDIRRLVTCVVYASEQAAQRIDVCGRIYPQPHYFEWCFANSFWSRHLAFDLDGVICEDAPFPDTQPEYAEFLHAAPPLYLPRKFPVTIITARCRRWEQLTREWLERHQVRVSKLIMWDADPDARWSTRDTIAQWKAEILRERHSRDELRIYCESDAYQARVIAERAGLPVICPQARRVFAQDRHRFG